MAENNFEASVGLKVDNASIDKAIKQVSTKLENGLSKADAKLSKQLSKQIDRDLNRLGKQLERSSEKASKVLEKGLKFGAGLAGSAIYAFLKNGSPAAERFAVSLENVKTAWGKVGQTLATKIKFGGLTGQEWVDRFANRLENLDTAQIEKALGYIKAMAALWVGFKTISIGIKGAEMIKTISSAISNTLQKLNIGQVTNNVSPSSSSAAATAFGVSRFRMREYSPEKMLQQFAQAKIQGKSKEYLDQLKANYIKESAGLRNQNIVRGGSAIASLGYGAIRVANTEGPIGGRISQGAGIAGAGILGTIIAGPIGGIIATSLAEGADLLSKGIAKAFEKSVDYFDKKLVSNRGPLWKDDFKSSDELAQDARRAREKLFEGQTNNAIFALRKSNVYRDYLNEQNGMFPSGQMPAFKLKTTNVVANVAEKINTLTMIEKDMLNTYETFTDMEKNTNVEFKNQLDAITAEKNFYIAEQNKQIATWKDAKEKEKSFNAAIKEVDRQVIDARTKYENTLTNINKDPNWNKPLQSSISMGGDISSLPAIISQSLNDQKNAQSEKLSEDFQKLIDTDLAQLQYQMDLFNLAAEEKKFREDTIKQDREDRKDIKTYVKEMRDAVAPGASTVTVMR